MALTLTQRARIAANQIGKTPQIVLVIDGLEDVFGSGLIVEVARYGGIGLTYGQAGLVYGGTVTLNDQETLISLSGTTTTIQQQLQPDKPGVSSVSSMQVTLVDKDGQITDLITPGEVVTDILGRRAKIFLGFEGTAYPDDFIIIFRGIIDDIVSGPGNIVFNIAHPDQKKRQEIFVKAEAELSAPITPSATTIPLTDASRFLVPVLGPAATFDPAIRFYVKIDDEIIRYTGKTGNDLTGATRGELGSTAAAHSSGDPVSSFYRLTEDAMTLALKIMLSGWNGPFTTDVEIESFNIISPTLTVPNAIFFRSVDLNRDYGLTAGDFITTTSATNGANNVVAKQIDFIVSTDAGDYAVMTGVSFVDETDSPAVASFRSQYDTLGEGLKMFPDEVDVLEHRRIFDLFLSSFEYDFYLKDTINGKEFIESEIYFPAASYPLPRKSRSSVGFHSGPIPGAGIPTLNRTNIKTPAQIKIRRAIGRHFYNTIVYKFEEKSLEEEFIAGVITTNATSKTQIPVGNKVLTIESKGMRSALSGISNATNFSTRRLNRYAFAAEFFERVDVLYKDGYNIEIGDLVLFDGNQLNISDTKTASRDFKIRFFEVVNKSLDLKTGNVSLSLLDTSFSTQNRYGLISPASFIKSGVSDTQFVIKRSFGGNQFGDNEFRKWDRYLDPDPVFSVKVRVRAQDFSVLSPAVAITQVSGNTITVNSSLGFTPLADYIMEMARYNDSTDQIKAIYGFMSDGASNFADGGFAYRML